MGFGKVLLKAVLMRDSHSIPAISVKLVDAAVFDLQLHARPSGSPSCRFSTSSFGLDTECRFATLQGDAGGCSAESSSQFGVIESY